MEDAGGIDVFGSFGRSTISPMSRGPVQSLRISLERGLEEVNDLVQGLDQGPNRPGYRHLVLVWGRLTVERPQRRRGSPHRKPRRDGRQLGRDPRRYREHDASGQSADRPSARCRHRDRAHDPRAGMVDLGEVAVDGRRVQGDSALEATAPGSRSKKKFRRSSTRQQRSTSKKTRSTGPKTGATNSPKSSRTNRTDWIDSGKPRIGWINKKSNSKRNSERANRRIRSRV